MYRAKVMAKIKEVYNKMKEDKKNEVIDKMISMTEDDFITEHRNLIKVLRSGDPKTLESEAKKQERELKDKTGLTGNETIEDNE
jgi:hypothetical protein